MPRKEKKFHFIYKTTNMLNGKYYYGMHSTYKIEDGYLGSGRRLRHSINKYGEDAHEREILEFVDSRKELKDREREIVNLNEIAKIDCMNLQIGGGGGFINEEHRKRCSDIGLITFKNKLKNDSEFADNFKTNCSNASRERWNDSKFRDSILKNLDWTGRKHTVETKQKLREVDRTGSNNSQYGTCWIYNNNESKKIKKEDLDLYQSRGWIKGRKLKR